MSNLDHIENLVYNLSQFDYDRKTKTLYVYSELFAGAFPSKIQIKSEKSGIIKTFVFDTDLAMENEFWDGEMAVLVPQEPFPAVTQLVIRHAY